MQSLNLMSNLKDHLPFSPPGLPIFPETLPIFPALFSLLRSTYFLQNYATIILQLGLPCSPVLPGHVLLFGHYISVREDFEMSENIWDFGLLFVEKYLLPKKKHFFY